MGAGRTISRGVHLQPPASNRIDFHSYKDRINFVYLCRKDSKLKKKDARASEVGSIILAPGAGLGRMFL